MSDETCEGAVSKDGSDASVQAPAFLRATAADLENLDFEAPIARSSTADCHELSDQFQGAVQPPDGTTQPPDTPAIRVFTTLSAITGMHFRPEEPNAPFGPTTYGVRVEFDVG